MTPEGLLLVNKPPGVTSHDVAQVLRRKLGLRRIGHTGTLDPSAEGLLLLLVGAATRHQQAFQGHDKTYEAILRFGLQTDTGDATGSPVRTAVVPALDEPTVRDALASFVGPVTQIPPAFSAVKVRGRPAYWWARRRQPVELSQRVVQIYELTLLARSTDTITVRVQCSAGTYVRVLAEAIGERLGSTAHLSHLIRTRIGAWMLDQAKPLVWIQEASADAIQGELLSADVGSIRAADRTPLRSA